MKGRNDFILQHEGSCCTLIALCNARRYFGLGSPSPGSWSWEYLIGVAQCRYGGVPEHRIDMVAKRLGLSLKLVGVKEMRENLPVLLVTKNPVGFGATLHSSLVIGVNDDELEMVNYRWKIGPVVENIPTESIMMPSHKKLRDSCFAIQQKNVISRSAAAVKRALHV